jgi:hypothetical protein
MPDGPSSSSTLVLGRLKGQIKAGGLEKTVKEGKACFLFFPVLVTRILPPGHTPNPEKQSFQVQESVGSSFIKRISMQY